MPNGKPGDHPIGDYYLHDHRIFPADVQAMLDRLLAVAERSGAEYPRRDLAWDEELRGGWTWTKPSDPRALDELRTILRRRLSEAS